MDHDAIKAAVREAIQEDRKDFYIDREEHYQHHQFIKGVKAGVEGCQSIIGKVTLVSVVGGVITVLVIGFVSWIKNILKG